MDPVWMASDVQPMIDGAGGTPMTLGAVTANVLLNAEDIQAANEEGNVTIGRQIEVIAKTGTFPGLIEGAAVTLGWPAPATAYTVVSQFLEGAVTRARLRRA